MKFLHNKCTSCEKGAVNFLAHKELTFQLYNYILRINRF